MHLFKLWTIWDGVWMVACGEPYDLAKTPWDTKSRTHVKYHVFCSGTPSDGSSLSFAPRVAAASRRVRRLPDEVPGHTPLVSR